MSEAPAGRARIAYKVHWHVVFTHFPISFFLASAGFMILHLFALGQCFDMAAYVALIAGAVMMLPTTFTGWTTWKGRYKGLRGKSFLYKQRMAYAMIGLSIVLVLWRTFFPPEFRSVWHYAYAGGIALLLAGAVAEGFYGGRFNHR